MLNLNTGKRTNVAKKEVEKIENNIYKDYNVSSLDIVSKCILSIPEHILFVMREIEKTIKDSEFSILCKTDSLFVKDNVVYIRLKEEYEIPKQTVSRISIEYEEDISGWDVVIHKHPNGCRTFSSTDVEYINSNFEFSILYVNGTFHLANMRIPFKNEQNIYLSMPINVEIYRELPIIEIPKDKLNKIVEEIPDNYPHQNMEWEYGGFFRYNQQKQQRYPQHSSSFMGRSTGIKSTNPLLEDDERIESLFSPLSELNELRGENDDGLPWWFEKDKIKDNKKKKKHNKETFE